MEKTANSFDQSSESDGNSKSGAEHTSEAAPMTDEKFQDLGFEKVTEDLWRRRDKAEPRNCAAARQARRRAKLAEKEIVQLSRFAAANVKKAIYEIADLSRAGADINTALRQVAGFDLRAENIGKRVLGCAVWRRRIIGTLFREDLCTSAGERL